MNCPVEEELAALADGDLPDDRRRQVLQHVRECSRCRALLDAIGRLDGMLFSAASASPPPAIVLAARRRIEPVLRPQPPEIMTLEQAADFLQIEPQQLGTMVDELPAFELAGQIRVRRASLLEWIRRREEDYSRDSIARCLGASGGGREGVAL